MLRNFVISLISQQESARTFIILKNGKTAFFPKMTYSKVWFNSNASRQVKVFFLDAPRYFLGEPS